MKKRNRNEKNKRQLRRTTTSRLNYMHDEGRDSTSPRRSSRRTSAQLAAAGKMTTRNEQGGGQNVKLENGNYTFELLNDKMEYLYDEKGSFDQVVGTPLHYNLYDSTSWPGSCSHGNQCNTYTVLLLLRVSCCRWSAVVDLFFSDGALCRSSLLV